MIRARTTLVCLALLLTILETAGWTENAATKFQSAELSEGNQPIKVWISSVSSLLDRPTRSYKFGQQIPISISLINTATHAVYTCLSGDIYQDLPQLKRDGQLVQYTRWQDYVLQTAAKERTCQKEDLPEQALLMPNEPKMVDFLVVVDDSSDPTGALAWYDDLRPGHYELSVQRHFGCCDGLTGQSNTIDFDITP